jgi:hypothetical protein
MSLLTQKQIQEIIDMATQQSEFAEILKLKLDHWNSNQKSTQVEIDWSKAPKYVVGAAINLSWLSENGCWSLGYQLATYDRPPFTPHPHAAIMAKYAEVAARRVDPWVEFERFSHCDMEWDGLPYHPDWTQGQTYRHIGDQS